MTAHDRLPAGSPAGDLLARLEQPEVAEAVNVLLDHADVLAFLVVALDGFLSRGEVIADSLAEGISGLRGAVGGAGPLAGTGLAGIDLKGLAGSLAALSGAVVAATPALAGLLAGPLSDPGTVRGLSRVASALAEGETRAAAGPGGPTGVVRLLRLLKDDEVSRGMGYLAEVARALGRALGPP